MSKRQPYFIQQSGDFTRLLRYGKLIRGSLWQIRVITNNQQSHARLGVIISKKNSPSAVLRNRLRRIFREYFRQHSLLKLPAIDVLIQSKQRISPAVDNQQCIFDLQSLIEKIK